MPSLQQEHSKIWERYIRQECRALRQADLAFVDKNWEAPRIPGKKRPRERSKPDFSGFLPGGRHVVFEAKATLLTTRLDFSAITDGQWDHLDKAFEHEACSFVYVLDGDRHKWVIPWLAILKAIPGRESFPFDNAYYQKQVGETWLDTLIRLEEVTR